MKREGRPPKAIRQEKNIGFYVTRSQYFIIKQKADAAGVNMSDYMRQAAVYAQVKSRWRAGDQELVRELVGMSNDLRRLMQVAEKEGVLNIVLYFKQYRDRFDDLLNRLSHDQ